jgi:hypothetical protein
MSNIFQKLGIGVADFGKWLATAVKDTVSLAAKVETILKAEQPLEKPFVSALSTVVADLEALVATSTTAVTASGLNFAADTQVYQQFLTVIADFKKLAPIVEEAVGILEGKPAASAATTSQTTATAASQSVASQTKATTATQPAAGQTKAS